VNIELCYFIIYILSYRLVESGMGSVREFHQILKEKKKEKTISNF